MDYYSNFFLQKQNAFAKVNQGLHCNFLLQKQNAFAIETWLDVTQAWLTLVILLQKQIAFANRNQPVTRATPGVTKL